jgi:hypothetical protein
MPVNNPRAASQRTQGKRPGDLTGTRGQTLAKDAAKAKAEEAEQAVADAKAEKEVLRNTVVSYVDGPREVNTVDTEGDEVDEDEEVEVRAKTEFIHVTYPIEDMTWGREVINAGDFDYENGRWNKAPVLGGLRTYNFQEGVKYEVPKELADHLRELGYVYEF